MLTQQDGRANSWLPLACVVLDQSEQRGSLNSVTHSTISWRGIQLYDLARQPDTAGLKEALTLDCNVPRLIQSAGHFSLLLVKLVCGAT